jgi:hypothetical protein
MYADWLDENGDPARAEFIRLQCRHAEKLHSGVVLGDDRESIRLEELNRQMRHRWLAELPSIHGVRWYAFHRGFPTIVVTSPTTLVRSAKRVWDVAPVDTVMISDLRGTGATTLGRSPILKRLRHITLERYYYSRDGEGPLRALLHSPNVSGLQSLRLTSCYLEDDAIRLVASSPHLTSLEWLVTGYGAVTDDGAKALLASPALNRLRGGPFRGTGLSGAMREKLRTRFPFA